MRFRVRAIGVEDAEALVRVHREAWEGGYAGLLDPEAIARVFANHERRVERWRRTALDDSGRTSTLLVEPEESRAASELAGPVGVTTFGFARDEGVPESTGELWAINLTPTAWGTGAGAALFAAAVAGLRERYDRAYLWVLDGNARARRFYEKQGWSPDGGAKVDERWQGLTLHEVRYSAELC